MSKKSVPRSSAHLFSSPVSIIAHRGGAREAPENTLAAFRQAVGTGYAIECDVRLTKDGRVVVFHDETLERTTNGQGRVADKDLRELQALDAGGGEKIPSLVDVLELIDGRAPAIIEVKCKEWGSEAHRMASALVHEIRAINATSSVVVASFNSVVLYHVKRMMPKVLRGLVFAKRSFFASKLWLSEPDLLMPDHHLITKDFVECMHANGYRVLPWTVDDVKDASRLIEHGVDGLITNRPTSLSSL